MQISCLFFKLPTRSYWKLTVSTSHRYLWSNSWLDPVSLGWSHDPDFAAFHGLLDSKWKGPGKGKRTCDSKEDDDNKEYQHGPLKPSISKAYPLWGILFGIKWTVWKNWEQKKKRPQLTLRCLPPPPLSRMDLRQSSDIIQAGFFCSWLSFNEK